MANGSFAGGVGTESDPYLIEDALDLDAVRNVLSASYKLISNIDLDVTPFNTGAGWVPIGDGTSPFIGTLDGDGYTISNMFINTTVNRGALFGDTTGATIKSFSLIDVNVTIDNIQPRCGIVGSSNSTIVENCFSSGVFNNVSRSGGIIGYCNTSSIVRNCYSKATFNPSGQGYVGGITGLLNNSTIENSFFIGWIGTYNNTGGLNGELSGTVSITNSYWDTEITNQATSAGGGTGKTTAEMKIAQTFIDAGWASETLDDGVTPVWILRDGEYPNLFFQTTKKYLFQDGTEIKKYDIISGWTSLGTAPATKDMFDTDGMNDLSIIDDTAIQALTSNTLEPLYWTDDESLTAAQTITNAIPNPKLVIPLQDLDIDGELQNFVLDSTINGNSILRIVASGDQGVSWKAFKTNTWQSIDIMNTTEVATNGMTKDEFNVLTQEQWQLLNANGIIRLAYYLDQENLTNSLNINSLILNENITIATPTLNSLTIIYDELDRQYSGLMFMNTTQQYYSTSIGEILQYLDYGILVAGQSSLDMKVILTNTYPFNVQNIVLLSEHSIEGLTVELSKSNTPFIANGSLLYSQILNFEEIIEFYVRLKVDSSAQVGGNFDIWVSADPV